MAKEPVDSTVEEVVETEETKTAAEQEAQDQADFDAGASMGAEGRSEPAAKKDDDQARDESGRFKTKEEEPAAKPAAKKDGKAAATAPPAKPEYVQVTKDQFATLTAAAEKITGFETQFSKAFGTIGDMQKILRGLQSQTPKGAAVKLPPGAFDAMKKDFPELAAHMQTAMEGILKDVEGTGAKGVQVDSDEFKAALDKRVSEQAAEDLADEFPDWKKIVGAVDITKGEKIDLNNQFRKWLGTKPQDYQDRVNNSNSAGVITRAIRMFKSETKTAAAAPAKPNGQAQARANRISEAVRPKGDGGIPPVKKNTDDDEFNAGFKSG